MFALNLVTETIDDLDAMIAVLSDLVEITDDDLQAFEKRRVRKQRPYAPVTLAFNLSDDEVARISVNRHRLPGVEIGTQMVRHYPFGELFAHAVGSVRRINEKDLEKLDPVIYSGTQFVGKRGVEQFYERSLHGEVGRQLVETDARGRIRQVLETHPPKQGRNVTLQLDSRLQIAAHAALGDRRGAIVAIDPRSGGVLALVSNPAYNPNLFVTGISTTDYRALTDARDTPLFLSLIHI